MFYTKGKRLVITKSARREMDGKFVLIRYAELADKIVVINIGQTTRSAI